MGEFKERLVWIDDLKGFAILLVVAGHVLATVKSLNSGSAHMLLDGLQDFIYLFHVPLFFSLAGLTFSIRGIGFCAFAKKRFLRLMVPYFFWGVFCALLYVLFGQGVVSDIKDVSLSEEFSRKVLQGKWWVPFVSIIHAGGWPDHNGFCFNGVLWFLPVLFVAELIYYWVAKWADDKCDRLALVGSLTMAFVLFENPLIWKFDLPYRITWVPKYLPFMVAGHVFSILFLRGQKRCCRGSMWLWLLSLGALFYFLIAYFFPCLGMGDVRKYVRFFVLAYPLVYLMIVMSRRGMFVWFRQLAPMTLGIMIFHKFPLVLLQVLIGKAHFPYWDLVIPSLLLSTFMLVVIVMMCCFASFVIERIIPWSLGLKKP